MATIRKATQKVVREGRVFQMGGFQMGGVKQDATVNIVNTAEDDSIRLATLFESSIRFRSRSRSGFVNSPLS